MTFVMGGKLAATVEWKPMSIEPSPVLQSCQLKGLVVKIRLGRGTVPLQIWLEMDLVAINNRLALFIRRHQRGEAADAPRALLLDQDVPQLRGLHLLQLPFRVPFCRRVLVVLSACLLDQTEASSELVL